MNARASWRPAAQAVALRLWRILTSPVAPSIALLLLLAVTAAGALTGSNGQPAAAQGATERLLWASADGTGPFEPAAWMIPGRLFEHSLFRAFGVVLAGLLVLWLLRAWLPSWSTPPAAGSALRRLELDAPPENFARALSWALAVSGQSVVRRSRQDGAEVLVARRAGAGGWLPGLLYAGVLLVMLASFVGWRYGWRSQPLALAVGEAQPLDTAGEQTLQLEQIQLFPQPNDRPPRVDSLVSVYEGGRRVAEIALKAGRRASYGGLILRQVGLGPVARLSATHAEAGELSLRSAFGETQAQPVRRVRLTGPQQEHLMAVVGHDLLVRLVHYVEPGQDEPSNGTLHLQLLRGSDGSLVSDRALQQAGEVTAGPVTVHLAPEYYVSVRAERQPERPLLYIGWGATLVGLLARLAWPPRELWIRLQAGGAEGRRQVVTAARGGRDAWYQAFLDLLTEAATALPVAGTDG